MTDLSELKCACCGEPIERVRYFPRQLLTAEDMRTEQEYLRQKARRHNRFLHGWGVVCGCTIEAVPTAKTPTIRVCPGYAVGPQGDEIWIDQCIDVDLKTGPQAQPCSVHWPCPPLGEGYAEHDGMVTVYIAVRYAECYSRPVRVHPAGCGCDETGCEYSRIRDSFEIKVLNQLPDSHVKARQYDEAWCKAVQETPVKHLENLQELPVPPCPECASDPWVVLSTVSFSTKNDVPGNNNNFNNLQLSIRDRRVLLATQSLQTAALCML